MLREKKVQAFPHVFVSLLLPPAQGPVQCGVSFFLDPVLLVVHLLLWHCGTAWGSIKHEDSSVSDVSTFGAHTPLLLTKVFYATGTHTTSLSSGLNYLGLKMMENDQRWK